MDLTSLPEFAQNQSAITFLIAIFGVTYFAKNILLPLITPLLFRKRNGTQRRTESDETSVHVDTRMLVRAIDAATEAHRHIAETLVSTGYRIDRVQLRVTELAEIMSTHHTTSRMRTDAAIRESGGDVAAAHRAYSELEEIKKRTERRLTALDDSVQKKLDKLERTLEM